MKLAFLIGIALFTGMTVGAIAMGNGPVASIAGFVAVILSLNKDEVKE